MKKYLSLTLPLFLSFFLPPIIQEEVTSEDCLDLPEEYFNYANIQLPAYLSTPPIMNADNTPSDNPITDAGATLGRVIFYDNKLSATNTQACADCHKQEHAFSDDSAFSRGFEGGFTGRNSMGLANARFYDNGSFFWDERAATLEDQVLQPIQDPVEMGLTLEELVQKLEATDYYPNLFEAAFGTTEINTDRIARAMAQFVRSMVSYQSKYDIGRAENFPGPPGMQPFSNFTASENLGKAIFFDPNRGNCAACHQTDAFIAPAPRNNGLDLVYEDNGVGEVTGIMNLNGHFKVPSLRNVELTFPYMHDGRFESLEEVVDHYNEGVQAHPNLSPQLREGGPMSPPRQLNLTDEEKTGLVDFMKTLTDYQFITDERWSNPFCIAPVSTEEALTFNFKVFPNPVNNILNIQIDQSQGAMYQIRLINLSGQLIKQEQADESVFQMDVSTLTRGVYFLHLNTAKKQSVRKVMIQ